MKGFLSVWRAFMRSDNRTAFLNGVASVAPDMAEALRKQKHRHDEDELCGCSSLSRKWYARDGRT